MAQGALPFEYRVSRSASGLTAFAGLGAVLDLVLVLDLARHLDRELGLRQDGRGWTDAQQILALVFLNLLGGTCVEDLERLEADEGFRRLLLRVEHAHLPRWRRRELERRWRKGGRRRALPSVSSTRRYLEAFRNLAEEKERGQGRAFIPTPSDALRSLRRAVAELVAFAQRQSPEEVATLDLDATLVQTTKKEALYAYKDGRAYQPLNVWWAEQELVLLSEFRDGNVPAGFENLRVFEEALEALPPGVEEVRFRSDSAAYQEEVLRYCEEGKSDRFGRIGFAIGADVSPQFRDACRELRNEDWTPIYEYPEGPTGKPVPTDREVAEVNFVPETLSRTKRGEYRFLATRSLRDQSRLPSADEKELPFQTYEVRGTQYVLRGIVTNFRAGDGWDAEDVVRFLDARCGRSEKAHDEMKSDLAGGRLPSKYFGANAAWWQIMLLSLNLSKLFKRFALGIEWARRRMKVVRFRVLALAGRVIESGRRLVLHLSESEAEAGELLLRARKNILRLMATGPPSASAT